MVSYLLIRPGDHLIVGCDLVGCKFVPAAGHGPGPVSITAAAPGARLVVTFPPQHLAEQLQDADATTAPPSGVWQAVLAGSSRIAVALPENASVPFTISGVLAALGQYPLISDAGGTAIEAPWRVVLTPLPAPGDTVLQALHRSQPLDHDGVTGMWHTAIGPPPASSSGQTPDVAAPPVIQLTPVDPAAAAASDPPFVISLGHADRVRLVTEAAQQPALADRLGLSALGAWLRAWGTWPSFTWSHELHQGRDIRVHTATRGTLYPTGHRATFTADVTRVVESGLGDAAVLLVRRVLQVDQPVAGLPAASAVTRRFPFDAVELITTRFDGLLDPQWQTAGDVSYFAPTDAASQAVSFAVRITGAGQPPVVISLPLFFVADPAGAHAVAPGVHFAADPISGLIGQAALGQLAAAYGQQARDTAGEAIDLVRSSVPAPGDRHEVHALTIAANPAAFAPSLASMQVAIPSLRGLLGADAVRAAKFADDYLSRGDAAKVILDLDSPLDIDFTRQSDRSGGLVAPKYAADALSRLAGPVNGQALLAAAGGAINPAALFPAEATLLGFALRDLVTDLKLPPQIVPGVDAGGRPIVTMSWQDIALKSTGCFTADGSSRLNLTVTAGADGKHTLCSVTNVGFELPPAPDALLALSFGGLSFQQQAGHLPEVSITGMKTQFTGDLRLLQELQDAVDLSALVPYFDIGPAGIVAHYSVPIPTLATGVFVLRDVAFSAQLDVPFDGRPVELTIGFASKQNRFALTVLAFGGGGYIALTMNHEGLQRFEIELEFGALIEVDFVVASAEVHALGGVQFILAEDGSVQLTGYLRIGGSVDILGLVSVSVELCIQLSYRSETNALIGRATMVVDIDLTLWSESVELDTGEWVLAGSSAPAASTLAVGGVVGAFAEPYAAVGLRAFPQPRRPPSPEEGLAQWKAYRSAFAGG
jgi:hypothetical protein